MPSRAALCFTRGSVLAARMAHARRAAPTASTDGAGGRSALGLSVSWAALVSPRAARGSLFVARAAPPASKATRGRPLVPQTTQAAPKCERAVGQLRQPEPGCLSFGTLRNLLTSKESWVELWTIARRLLQPSFCALASPPLAVWRRELRDALALAIKQTFEHCNSGARISINCSSQTPVPHKSDKSRTAAVACPHGAETHESQPVVRPSKHRRARHLAADA